jgi:hypothetical protein
VSIIARDSVGKYAKSIASQAQYSTNILDFAGFLMTQLDAMNETRGYRFEGSPWLHSDKRAFVRVYEPKTKETAMTVHIEITERL